MSFTDDLKRCWQSLIPAAKILIALAAVATVLSILQYCQGGVN